MDDKNDKQKLYLLINEYLSGKISESKFCDEFYRIYDLLLDKKILTEDEKKIFSELSSVVNRFSQYDEDHKLDPRAFSTSMELKKAIALAQERLM